MENLAKLKFEELRNKIKIKFGLPPDRPTDDELNKILGDINNVPESNRTEDVWRTIVFKHVNNVPIHKYFGLDNSDLNTLYAQLLQALINKK